MPRSTALEFSYFKTKLTNADEELGRWDGTPIDLGDDFTSAEDMEKYAEVREKQRNVEAVKEKEDGFSRGVWVGFTFGKNGPNVKAFAAMGGSDDGALATIF